jgi:hypothetical protein
MISKVRTFADRLPCDSVGEVKLVNVIKESSNPACNGLYN